MFAIILFAIFLVLMFGIGLWGMKKTSSVDDYVLGGRNIGPWMSALSFGTAYFSAVLFIGFAGKIGWGFGANGLWIAIGNAIIGSLGAWLVMGARARRMSQNLGVMTVPAFLSERFGSHGLKFLAATVIFVFLLPYSASVYKGLGHLFVIVFGLEDDAYKYAVIGMAIVTACYMVLGGYFAVSLIDFILGMVMLFGSVMMVWMLVSKAMGLEVVANYGNGMSGLVSAVQGEYQAHVPEAKQPAWWALSALVFMTSFSTWGLPQMSQKFFAMKDPKMFVKGGIATCLFAGVIGGVAYGTGSLLHVFYRAPKMAMNAAGEMIPVWDKMIPELLKAELPEWLLAVILLLLFSASMSTLAALIMTSASAVVVDFMKGGITPRLNDKQTLKWIRIMSAVFVAVSCLIAMNQFSFIVTLMSFSWGATAGTFMAVMIYGFFWKRMTATGAYAGMLSGLLIALGLFSYVRFGLGNGKLVPSAACVAMIVPMIVVPVVSLLTKAPSKEMIDRAFDGVSKEEPAKEPVFAMAEQD